MLKEHVSHTAGFVTEREHVRPGFDEHPSRPQGDNQLGMIHRGKGESRKKMLRVNETIPDIREEEIVPG